MESLKCEVCMKVMEGHTQNQVNWYMDVHKLTHKEIKKVVTDEDSGTNQ